MIAPGKASLWVILASATTTVMAGSVIAPVLNLMGEGLGVSPGLARLLITTHGLFIALCSPALGFIIDRIGVRGPFILGLTLYGLAGASGLIITDYWLLIVSRVLLGVGVASVFTCNTVLILNFYEGYRRNQVMGWRASGGSIGGVAWPLLGGFLGTFSWHMPFAAYLIGLPLALLALFTIPETQKGAARMTVSVTGKQESVLSLFRSTPIIFSIYGLVFIMNTLLYAVVVFLPKVVEQFGITSPFYIGIYISFMALIGGGTSVVYGRIRERLSYKAIVLITMALWVAAFAAIYQAFSTWLVWLAITLFGVGMGMSMPAVPVWVGELVPASFRGRMTAYIATFSYIGQFLSPIILSPVESSLGLNYVFLVVAALCAVIFLLFLTLLRR
jgi:ACDE family multidrug resistance protein